MAPPCPRRGKEKLQRFDMKVKEASFFLPISWGGVLVVLS
jgi:hypothetical protein